MKIKYLFLPILVVAALFHGCSMKLSQNAIDADEYLETVKTSPNVYKENSDGLIIPFNFSHDDFGKLILFRIKGHPEIKEVELIVQDDNKGAFVVVYYENGKVENYLSSNFTSEKEYVKLDRDWDIIENHDFEYSFNDTPHGINFALDIALKNGYKIKVDLQTSLKEKKRFSILATIGVELKNVKRFPFIYLKDAGLIPVKGTKSSFSIDGKKVELIKTPINVEGQKCLKSVYSFKRLPFFLNEEQNSFLTPETRETTRLLRKDNVEYSFFDNNGRQEIEKILYKVNGHSAQCG